MDDTTNYIIASWLNGDTISAIAKETGKGRATVKSAILYWAEHKADRQNLLSMRQQVKDDFNEALSKVRSLDDESLNRLDRMSGNINDLLLNMVDYDPKSVREKRDYSKVPLFTREEMKDAFKRAKRV